MGFISRWLESRREREEALRREKLAAIKAKVLAESGMEGSITGRFDIVKKQIDEAIDAKKQAYETAQKVVDLAGRAKAPLMKK